MLTRRQEIGTNCFRLCSQVSKLVVLRDHGARRWNYVSVQSPLESFILPIQELLSWTNLAHRQSIAASTRVLLQEAYEWALLG